MAAMINVDDNSMVFGNDPCMGVVDEALVSSSYYYWFSRLGA